MFLELVVMMRNTVQTMSNDFTGWSSDNSWDSVGSLDGNTVFVSVTGVSVTGVSVVRSCVSCRSCNVSFWCSWGNDGNTVSVGTFTMVSTCKRKQNKCIFFVFFCFLEGSVFCVYLSDLVFKARYFFYSRCSFGDGCKNALLKTVYKTYKLFKLI